MTPLRQDARMEQRVSLITLGVGDLARSRAFYQTRECPFAWHQLRSTVGQGRCHRSGRPRHPGLPRNRRPSPPWRVVPSGQPARPTSVGIAAPGRHGRVAPLLVAPRWHVRVAVRQPRGMSSGRPTAPLGPGSPQVEHGVGSATQCETAAARRRLAIGTARRLGPVLTGPVRKWSPASSYDFLRPR
jgi:hypothetical protein